MEWQPIETAPKGFAAQQKLGKYMIGTLDSKQRLANLNLAIARAGGIVSFARKMGVSHQTVSYWRKQCCVPPARAITIEQLFGVPRANIVNPTLARLLSEPDSAGESIL